MNEIVYVLINEAMPGYAKIGRTTDLEQRIRSLDTTGVPLPFECYYACTVTDANFVEKQLHNAFDDHRVRSNREWFEIAPDRIAAALRIAQIAEVTPKRDFVESAEDQAALDKARVRLSNFNFAMVKIPVGATLTFVKNQDVICQVVDNRSVLFNDQIVSISAATQMALGDKRPVRGPLYWEYEGESLVERRIRMEEAV